MSFSTNIKDEVTRLDSSKEELISELSAIVRNSAILDKNITIYIENNGVARRIFKLFKNVYEITPIITVRKKYFSNGLSYILTIKSKVSEILDDLSIVKDNNYLNIPQEYIYSDEDLVRAYNGVMYFEDIRIYRDHKNMTNRLNNCEQANMDKIFLTASSQIRDIKKLEEYDIDDLVDEKIKVVMEYRLKYPEVSLGELSEIISSETGSKITKSGLNHRFRKIREIVNNIENK